VNRTPPSDVTGHEGAQVVEDGEIIRRCLGGQASAIDALVDRYKTDLYSLCVRLARNGPDADDLFQDTWVRVMKSLATYNPDRPFRTWLFAVCTNRYRDLCRRRSRWWLRLAKLRGRGEGAEGVAQPGGPAAAGGASRNPEEEVVSRERSLAVRTAMERLDDAFRLPILLHYFGGLSVAEIAEILVLPTGTVKTRLLRGREKLKTALEAAGHER